ncbi:DinB family protein [Acidobacteria bacterium AB60]|nr:DinB family protein [Acidobacteria bacterium AB60]
MTASVAMPYSMENQPFKRRTVMPVPAVIEGAAQNFRYNDKFLADCHRGLSEEEWRRRPSDCSNSLTWVVGHLVWARKRILDHLDTEWSTPWLDQFARGRKPETDALPTSAELATAWTEVSGLLATALENASEETLARPATQGPPSADGKLSGVINFLAWHETYHVGQAAYLRCWLGHKSIMG